MFEQVPTNDNCEFVAVKITCKNNSVIFASLYRPTKNDCEYSVHLASAVENLAKGHPKDVIWIGGDANLPDIDWSTNTICGSNYMYKKEINGNLLHITQTCPCNIQQYITAVKMIIFR